jgi:hypothetical protein
LRFQNLANEIIEYPLINILNNQNKVWLTWIANNNSLNEGLLQLLIILKDIVQFIMKEELF